ncbi:MAG TPA: hypothetical protein VMW67_04860 [Desulfobacteria bacterium]|nr:hypothetical protein [Desulfobacteria bacterium]
MGLFEILKIPEVIGAFFGAFFAVLIGFVADIAKNHLLERQKRRKERVTVLKLLYQDLRDVNEHTDAILKGFKKFGVPKGYLQKLPFNNWKNLQNSDRLTQFLTDEFFMDIIAGIRQIYLINEILDDYSMIKEPTMLGIAALMYEEAPARAGNLMEKIELELKLKKAV